MKDRFNRRDFLGTTLATSLLTRARLAKVATLSPAAGLAQEAATALPGFDDADGEALRAAIDEIIPEGDGMPAASAAGVLDYFGTRLQQDASLVDVFRAALEQLETMSRERFDRSFPEIGGDDRVELLTQLQTASPELFEPLRIAVYEAYYTRPEVWALIGYEPHPSTSAGPMMAPFDADSLARVRALPPLYREVE